MSSSKAATGLDTEQVAQSAYRACCHASGAAHCWDGLAPEEQCAWLALAGSADALLHKYEGASYADAGREVRAARAEAGLATLPLAPWGQAPPREKLAWVAVARHLVALLDEADEIEDLGALELSWAAWVEKRLP